MLRCFDGKQQDPDVVGFVSLAPDGKLLAVDVGTSHVRSAHFFSLADGKAVGKPLTYVSGNDARLFWHKDSALVMVQGPKAGARGTCTKEMCEFPLSIVRYTPATGKRTQLYDFEPLCDIILEDYKDNLLTASRECFTVEQWQASDFPKPSEQRLTYTFTDK